MIIRPKLVVLLLAMVVVGQTNGDDDEEVVRFTVDPAGATTHHTAKLGKIKCIFSYSAVGGTREEWVMTLARRSDNEYTCDIERPEGTSYMYFQSFAGSLTKVTLESAELFDNNGALLLNEDFLIKENTVFQGPSFQSNFVSLRMVGKKDN